MSIIRTARRAAWRLSSALGDLDAANRAIRSGTPAPLLKRYARKRIYRAEGRATRRLLRKMGL